MLIVAWMAFGIIYSFLGGEFAAHLREETVKVPDQYYK